MEFPYFFAKYGDKEMRVEKRELTILDGFEATLLLRAEDDGAVLTDEYRDKVLSKLEKELD